LCVLERARRSQRHLLLDHLQPEPLAAASSTTPAN
jgi:hypothetical protein